MNPLFTSPLSWDVPGGAVTAIAIAAVAGLVAAGFAARALAGRTSSRRSAALAAAAARGLAVAAAILAAAAPHLVSSRTTDSARLVAADQGAAVREFDADLVVTWPDQAPDAAAALETLRAGAPVGTPADLLLRVGDASPAGPAVEHALRGDARMRAAIIGRGAAAAALPLDDGVAERGMRISVPTGSVAGVPVTLTVTDAGTPFVGERATLTVEGREGTLTLTRGQSRVETQPLELDEGTHLVTVRAPGRTPAVAFVEVVAPPQVVFVTADAAAGTAISDVLVAQGVPTTVLAPERAARDGFGQADVIILGPGARGTALDARVSGRVQTGTGVLVLGGKGEDGLRRHAGGLVEPHLPVILPPEPPPPPPTPPTPDPPPPPEPPDPPESDLNPDVKLDEGPKLALRVALLLVVDRSGSMRGRKLDLAKQAAIAAARNLDPQDRVGVLAFDDKPQWIAPFQTAEDLPTLGARLGALRAEGGTNFHPALKIGFEKIREEACGIRHVILLSDGASRTALFRQLIMGAAANRITLSAIAIGNETDDKLLGQLVGWGKGRLWYAKDAERLPEVVTMDTRRIAVDVRAERAKELDDAEGLSAATDPPPPPAEPTAAEPDPAPDVEPEPDPEPEETAPPPRIPRLVADASFLAGLRDAQWPALAHPEDPTARSVALVVMAWDGGEQAPALTLGRSGSARIAVLAADVATADGRATLAWERGPAFLAQLVRSLAEPPPLDRGGVVAALAPALDGSARIAIPLDGDGTVRLRATPESTPLLVGCAAMKPGWTGGRTDTTPDAGVFSGLFMPSTDGAPPRRVALVSSGRARPATHALGELAAAANVRILAEPPALRSGQGEERREPVDAPLLGAAAALMLTEALLRRLV